MILLIQNLCEPDGYVKMEPEDNFDEPYDSSEILGSRKTLKDIISKEEQLLQKKRHFKQMIYFKNIVDNQMMIVSDIKKQMIIEKSKTTI